LKLRVLVEYDTDETNVRVAPVGELPEGLTVYDVLLEAAKVVDYVWKGRICPICLKPYRDLGRHIMTKALRAKDEKHKRLYESPDYERYRTKSLSPAG